MIVQKSPARQRKVLDEIIDNAIELPIESQKLLLILAKGMAFTRDCLTKQNLIGQARKPPGNYST